MFWKDFLCDTLKNSCGVWTWASLDNFKHDHFVGGSIALQHLKGVLWDIIWVRLKTFFFSQTPTPPENERMSPEKGAHIKRKVHLPSTIFRGASVSFREGEVNGFTRKTEGFFTTWGHTFQSHHLKFIWYVSGRPCELHFFLQQKTQQYRWGRVNCGLRGGRCSQQGGCQFCGSFCQVWGTIHVGYIPGRKVRIIRNPSLNKKGTSSYLTVRTVTGLHPTMYYYYYHESLALLSPAVDGQNPTPIDHSLSV